MSNAHTSEIVREIFTVASLLMKFDRDDILLDPEHPDLFIEMLNEMGYRSVGGRPFTKMGFRQLMARLDHGVKIELIEEFNLGHQPVYRQMLMHSNGK